MKIITVLLLICMMSFCGLKAEETTNRWKINGDGSISWIVDGSVPHEDHIEMSGLRISFVARYGVDSSGAFSLKRSGVWPLLRTVPNNTHASLAHLWDIDPLRSVLVNGEPLGKESVKEICLNGLLTVYSDYQTGENTKLGFTREVFPSVNLLAFCERYVLKNTGDSPVSVMVGDSRTEFVTEADRGVDGSYCLTAVTTGEGTYVLKPGEQVVFGAYFTGNVSGEPPVEVDVEKEKAKREKLIAELKDKLVLETPDEVINTMFAFAKIRGSESIYLTKGGLMHGPGGEAYYAAIWANDQAEYINPFFPFLGYETGNASALNAFRHFARFMNPEYKPIPSSIIAEGTDVWDGAGDRGDAAMIAYGAARYALSEGSVREAEELWPLIEWCLEYCRRKVNTDGVVESDSDELEGRFPAGKANLCTSSLYYDALMSAVFLGKELGKEPQQIGEYEKRASQLRKAIDRYFGGEVEGFDTYRYYQGNDVLRSWICIPLTVGIFDRKEGTVAALFSPRLWTRDGLLTQAGSETFWDRSTLYALRGVFAAGETEKAADYLEYYSNRRLLGEHVPYAIEAYPEGKQRHLSAESGLYCRVITEGLFGIRPTGLHSFSLTPRLPEKWERMALREIRAFGRKFDVEVVRRNEKIEITVVEGKKTVKQELVHPGESVAVILK